MTTAEVSSETLQKLYAGIDWLPSKVSWTLKIVSATCMSTAKASHKTIKNETQDDAKAVFESLIQQRRAGRGTTANMWEVANRHAEMHGDEYMDTETNERTYAYAENTLTNDQEDALAMYAGNQSYRDMNDSLRAAEGEWPECGVGGTGRDPARLRGDQDPGGPSQSRQTGSAQDSTHVRLLRTNIGRAIPESTSTTQTGSAPRPC